MSINFYQELAKDRKITTIKYPTNKETGEDWEYVITDKKDLKELEACIQKGKIKDMKTILFKTKELILKESRIRGEQ